MEEPNLNEAERRGWGGREGEGERERERGECNVKNVHACYDNEPFFHFATLQIFKARNKRKKEKKICMCGRPQCERQKMKLESEANP